MKLLFTLLSIPNAIALLTCRNCAYNADGTEVCKEECTGDMCYEAKYFYNENTAAVTTDSGCFVGYTGEAGCRSNQDGHILCTCSSNLCNLNISYTPATVIPLDSGVCDRLDDTGLSDKSKYKKVCAANFCTYNKHEYQLDNFTHPWTQKNCSRENDFDIFSSNAVVFSPPNACMKLTYKGQTDEVACYGAKIDYTAITYPIVPAPVECIVDYYSQALPHNRTNDTCLGQMCFISANSQGEVYRGCASFSDNQRVATMNVGYYRSHSGMEQWLCSTPKCNYDLNTAESSWGAAVKLEYRNISRLQQWPIFYVINGSGVNQLTFSWFFLIFLIVYTL